MKKILLLLLVLFVVQIAGAQVIEFGCFTRSTDSSPWLDTALDSVLLIRYEDDGITYIESLYTNALGRVATGTATDQTSTQRVYATKTGYSLGDNGWLEFTTSALVDSTDTIVVALRGLAATADSTVTISFTLIDIDGTGLSGQRISHYSSAPYRGTDQSLTIPSRSDTPYRSKTYTAASTGLVEITTLKGSTNYIRVGDINLTIPFVATENMSLDSLRFYP